MFFGHKFLEDIIHVEVQTSLKRVSILMTYKYSKKN